MNTDNFASDYLFLPYPTPFSHNKTQLIHARILEPPWVENKLVWGFLGPKDERRENHVGKKKPSVGYLSVSVQMK
jgi:hypothetical protein